MPFLLCTYVRDSYNGYGKYPPGTSLYGSKVGVFKLELLTNSGIVQTNLFQIRCLLKNGKKKDAWRRHPIYFIIRFKLIAVAERRQ